MTPVTAMVVGPDEHGVVRHAMTIADAVDAPIERHLDLSTVTAGSATTISPSAASATCRYGPGAIDISDAQGEVVAVAASTRAAARRRRTASAAVDHLFTRQCQTTDEARLVALDADIDLAATFRTAANGSVGSDRDRA